jgi:hypothetical protein
MNTFDHYLWLNHFADLLEAQTKRLGNSPDPKRVAELRIAERTLNSSIDHFVSLVEEVEHEPVSIYLSKNFNDQESWKALKSQRNRIADTLSNIIESDAKIQERYMQYCGSLKQTRALSAML